MTQLTELDIHGYRSQPVANTFWRQETSPSRLALVMPGLGYSADMPLLYYPTRLLADRGVDVLSVHTAYNRNPAWQAAKDNEQTQWLHADAAAALHTAQAQREYSQVILIGKSLGTMGMAALLGDAAGASQPECVWLTPVLSDPAVRRQLLEAPGRGLVAIGTADPYFDRAVISQLQEMPNLRVMVVEGADHSLEARGNLTDSLKILSNLLREIETFVG